MRQDYDGPGCCQSALFSAKRMPVALWRKLTKPPADFDLEVASSKTAVLRFGSAATQHVIGTAENRPKTFNFLAVDTALSEETGLSRRDAPCSVFG